MKVSLPTIVLILTLFCSAGNAATDVHTVAGAYVGNGEPATSAALAFPQYVAVDSRGNLYVSDQYHCRLRKVAVDGKISTIAGTGLCGFSGDGGSAVKAQIYFPSGVAVDSQGNVFFFDFINSRVRMISRSGTIATVAGNGTNGFCGDGGLATKACLYFPTALVVGSGSDGEILYIADTYNDRIRQVALSTGVIITVAGNGTRGYSGDGGLAVSASLDTPQGLALYSQSNSLWISDSDNHAVRKVDTSTGVITTFFGDGSCGITLCFPEGISVDASGNLYVSATGNGDVLEVQVPSGVSIIKAGNGSQGYTGDGGPAVSAALNAAQDVLIDQSGNLLIVDTQNDRVRMVNASGIISTIVGGDVGDGGKSNLSSLNWAQGIAFDKAGNLYIADTWNNRIRKVTTAGTISTIAGTGVSGYAGDGGPASEAEIYEPVGVAVDGLGNIYVADYSNGAIRKIDATGTISTFATSVFISALAVDGAGNLYGSDSGFCVIHKFTPSGQSSIIAGVDEKCGYNGDGIPATQAEISFPEGLVLDSKGNLYFSDMNNNRVRVVNSQGIINTIAGDGNCSFSGDSGPAAKAELCGPEGIGIDTKANLYIADAYNGRIRVVNSAGIINTYAGDGGGGYNGNGLPALNMDMEPFPIAVSPAGIVYYGDILSYLVRKIH